MKSLIQFILNNQLKIKGSRLGNQSLGFTLIELLVGIIMAALIITPLLGFAINILDTDRREQAKANSEQEIQAALDYIARDLDQAIYIYDQDGVNAISNQLPNAAGQVPVLVFWKRQFLPNSIPAGLVPCNDPTPGACPAPNNLVRNCNNPALCDDTFVYSLVAYYLVEDASCNNTSIWSCTARIGRFQISDGIFVGNQVIRPRDAGFRRFNLNQGGGLNFKQKMNTWQNAGAFAANNLPQSNILIDYVDRGTDGINANCNENDPAVADDDEQQVPAILTGGFYTCVRTDENGTTSAQVFIRGNAKARIEDRNNPPVYNANQRVYFPSASIRVKGRGFLSNPTQ